MFSPSLRTAEAVIRLICEPLSQRARISLFHGLAFAIVATAVPSKLCELDGFCDDCYATTAESASFCSFSFLSCSRLRQSKLLWSLVQVGQAPNLQSAGC